MVVSTSPSPIRASASLPTMLHASSTSTSRRAVAPHAARKAQAWDSTSPNNSSSFTAAGSKSSRKSARDQLSLSHYPASTLRRTHYATKFFHRLSIHALGRQSLQSEGQDDNTQ